MMSRASKLQTCCDETLKILDLIKKFNQNFNTQVSRLQARSEIDKPAYAQLLKDACLVVGKISALQSNERLMRRPFVFEGIVYDLRHGREYLRDRLNKFRAKAEKLTGSKM